MERGISALRDNYKEIVMTILKGLFGLVCLLVFLFAVLYFINIGITSIFTQITDFGGVQEVTAADSDTIDKVTVEDGYHGVYVELGEGTSESVDELVLFSKDGRVVDSAKVYPNTDKIQFDEPLRDTKYIIQVMDDGSVKERTEITVQFKSS